MPDQPSASIPHTVILSKAEGRVEGPAVACSLTAKSRVPHPRGGFIAVGWGALLRRALKLRPLQTALLSLTLLFTLGASDPNSRFQKLGHEMICTCGCGQILLECNHVGCGVSAPMISELHTQVAGGGTNTSILNWFTVKYGGIVLAAPMHSGFGNVAWITPFAVFFLATIGTAVIIRVWKLRSGTPALASQPWSSPEHTALRDRIRRETEY